MRDLAAFQEQPPPAQPRPVDVHIDLSNLASG
jgi:hypothetical protein